MRKNLSSSELKTIMKWDRFHDVVFTKEKWGGHWCIYCKDYEHKTPESEIEKALYPNEFVIMKHWVMSCEKQVYPFDIEHPDVMNDTDWIEMSVSDWFAYSKKRREDSQEDFKHGGYEMEY